MEGKERKGRWSREGNGQRGRWNAGKRRERKRKERWIKEKSGERVGKVELGG